MIAPIEETAVVILYYNKVSITEACLSSALETNLDPKSIFAFDNGSKDVFSQKVKELFPQINHLGIEQNGGFSRGFPSISVSWSRCAGDAPQINPFGTCLQQRLRHT